MTEQDSPPYLSPILEDLVPQLKYKPGWQLRLGYELADDGAGGWHFFVTSYTQNSLYPSESIRVRHGFLVPAASYNRETWIAWLFNRLRDVETHEAGEFFQVDGVREFAPHHGNGEDPYLVWHMGDYETAKKRAGED